jgi:class 3 adenylate cyclase/tetratricopeptide (TPR) repeat protein
VDIGAWLKDLGLEEYAAAFHENAVDADVLPDLTAEDLKDIGVGPVGHRRKILAAIARLTEAAGGATAPGASVTADATVAAGRDAAGERRHVAVLFADLVGYTRLTETLGAEAMHELLNAFFSKVDAIVEHAGGRVDKHIGDCVMAVFGAPIAHGSDAQRAVLAALEIRKAVPELRAAAGQDIDVHVGVTTGVVVASYVGAGMAAEYAVTGESVNLASRLTDAAGPGEILISDGLYRALEGRLACESAGTLSVKGISEPVPAWRLIGLSAGHVGRGPLVGRRAELSQFTSILHACRDDGVGHVVVLRGEAGIGKTRLGEEFERMAQESGFACHRGLVLDFGAEEGRDAIRAVVRDILGVGSRSLGEALQEAARNAVERGVVPPDLEVHLHDLLDAPLPERLRAIYDAMDEERREDGRGAVIARVVDWATARQPRLLVVEDVHWAGAPLLRALAQMARAIADRRAILLVSSRAEGDPMDRAWRSSVADTPFTTIDLSPLRSEDARALCEAAIDDPTTIESLVARAEGNPLFLDQLLRHSRGHGAAGVPGTIQSLVQETIDQLSQPDKLCARAASVIGQRVDPEIVRHLTQTKAFDPASLVARGLLRPVGQDYLFVHALIRDAVYASLMTETRSALHRRAADWFAGRDPRLQAEHLALAGAPEAAAAFLGAARAEIAKYRYEAALSLIERGLALADAPDDRISLQLLRGDVLHDCGRLADAERSYSLALERAPRAVDRCRGLIGLAAVKRVTEDIDGALEELRRAEEAVVAEDLPAERSRIHFLRGNLLFPRGEFEACFREHEEGLRFARLAERPDLEAASLGGLGDAEYARGRMASARRRLEECVQLAKAQGLGRIEVANLAQIAHAMMYTASQQDAYEAACAAIASAVEVGHSRAEINARAATVKSLFGLARYQDCLEDIGRFEASIATLGTIRFRQVALMFAGRALHALGRREESIASLEAGLAFARETAFAFHGPSIAAALAVVTQERARKMELLEVAQAGIAAGCVGHNQYRVYADAVDVAFELRDTAMLRRSIDLAEAFPPGETVAWSTFHAMRGRALLRRIEEGDTAETRAALGEVKRRGDELAMRHWVAQLPG